MLSPREPVAVRVTPHRDNDLRGGRLGRQDVHELQESLARGEVGEDAAEGDAAGRRVHRNGAAIPSSIAGAGVGTGAGSAREALKVAEDLRVENARLRARVDALEGDLETAKSLLQEYLARFGPLDLVGR